MMTVWAAQEEPPQEHEQEHAKGGQGAMEAERGETEETEETGEPGETGEARETGETRETRKRGMGLRTGWASVGTTRMAVIGMTVNAQTRRLRRPRRAC
jgi:hypothetical protein